ncbi:kinase-like protein [Polychaeton citri CBS 116435]|uniref:non-specific serine/threonine protein kinase n=1 Tax=Polychaeton citri CBS 116435 TaxID=1314669 RepID=A0A9P4QA52_9PEZI|nr:kinase-like protein [Polychaeton citri CBS 116435]
MSAGDMSLTQSLGGLRIANPDDEEDAVSSPITALPEQPEDNATQQRPPPPSSSHSSVSTVTASSRPAGELLPQLSHEQSYGSDNGSSLGWNPDSYTLGQGESPDSGFRDYRQGSQGTRSDSGSVHSVPQQGSAQVPAGYQPQQAMGYSQHATGYGQGPRQPSQSISAQRPMSQMYNQSNNSASSGFSSQASYNYRQELSSSEGSAGVGLSRSVSSRARPMLGQTPSRESSRSYRSARQLLNGGNGPLPPRRNSKRVRAPTGGSDGFSGSAPQPRTAEEWQERGAATVRRQETDAASSQAATRTLKKGVKDFHFGRTLGEGSYSTVLAAQDRQSLKEYAIKVLDKRHIIKENKVKYVNIERDTLNRLGDHPGVVRLYYTFQDERSLYFVLDLASGGELLGVLKSLGSFNIECTRFYGAQILDSISYMHSRGVIHRDLKPENVLLDKEMHVKITDFGTAKMLPDPAKAPGPLDTNRPGNPMEGADSNRAPSFVGTAEYVSPELLRDKNACKASDLWAFGCIIYQLLAGRPPFKAANEYLTFQKILALDYTFPDGFPELARDLVERLLVLEPANRLPTEYVQSHPFFEGVSWGKSLWRQKVPRLQRYVPPPKEPIKLNGSGQQALGKSGSQSGPSGTPLAAQAASAALSQPQRPQLRGVTDLPPPSQLDIDWSPVLSHNERILKLSNLVVITAPQQHNSSPGGNGKGDGGDRTPSEKPKFSRFFSGNTTKRRERLVLITSNARIVIAAAGGNEKKAKSELRLLSEGCSWKSYVDSKGLTGWQVDTKDKRHTFEDPRATTSDPAGSKFNTQEWLEAVDNACELARTHQALQSSQSYSSSMNDFAGASAISSPSDSFAEGPTIGGGTAHHLRSTLRRPNTTDDGGGGLGDSGKDRDGNGNAGLNGSGASKMGRKRFSKRHSKSGLAAVF